MALGLTQTLKEMSTRNIPWGVKVAGSKGWQPYHLRVPIVLKSGSLNLLEPSGPVQACNGIALLLPLPSLFSLFQRRILEFPSLPVVSTENSVFSAKIETSIRNETYIHLTDVYCCQRVLSSMSANISDCYVTRC